MKKIPLAMLLAGLSMLSFVIYSCKQTEEKPSGATQSTTEANTGTSSSPLNGAWELYSTESEGKITYHKQPWQIKVHSDGHHCMMQHNKEGKFDFAAAGSYELNGKEMKETFTYHSYEPWIGVSMWWDWSISANGDTAYFSGPNKIIMADGRDITHEWEAKIFEKKVRVK
jgi:hypothetical protein